MLLCCYSLQTLSSFSYFISTTRELAIVYTPSRTRSLSKEIVVIYSMHTYSYSSKSKEKYWKNYGICKSVAHQPLRPTIARAIPKNYVDIVVSAYCLQSIGWKFESYHIFFSFLFFSATAVAEYSSASHVITFGGLTAHPLYYLYYGIGSEKKRGASATCAAPLVVTRRFYTCRLPLVLQWA